MPTALVPAAVGAAPAVRRRAEPDVRTATGARLTAAAARRLADSVPKNSRDARSSRWRGFTQWCAVYDWGTDEPNAVVSYLADLGNRGHPAKVLESHLGTLRALRAVKEAPLSDAEVKACLAIVRHRAGEEASAPDLEPGPLRPTPSTWMNCG
ncbi:hypothetical protein ACH4FX_41270 [Streptomyces sp. NPDC018019]|uniref:hypothetical protein n=1 Tax=Streptomyces sp. NPDC018019 TaxID=3365030 RepID=UPI003792EF0D